MNASTKTSKTAKVAKIQPVANPQDDVAPVAVESEFSTADEVAYFIHHNPLFGTLPLDEQDALRQKLIGMKRAEAGALAS